MPADSTLFQRVIPAVLIGMAALTVILILIAAGVVLGVIPWR